MQLTRVALSIAILAVAGCVSQPTIPVDPAGRMIDTKLSESIQKIDHLLGDISRAGGLWAAVPKVGKVVVKKGNLVTVQWQGDAPEILRQLADAKGLRFAMRGRPVQIPVSINATDTNFVEILENIGTQLGSRADVVLKADALEIHYRAI